MNVVYATDQVSLKVSAIVKDTLKIVSVSALVLAVKMNVVSVTVKVFSQEDAIVLVTSMIASVSAVVML